MLLKDFVYRVNSVDRSMQFYRIYLFNVLYFPYNAVRSFKVSSKNLCEQMLVLHKSSSGKIKKIAAS
jgi:hypothetical protein